MNTIISTNQLTDTYEKCMEIGRKFNIYFRRSGYSDKIQYNIHGEYTTSDTWDEVYENLRTMS